VKRAALLCSLSGVLWAAPAFAQAPSPAGGSTGRLFGVDDEAAPGMPASRPRVVMRLAYTRAPGAEACPEEQSFRDLMGARVRGWAPFAPNAPWRLAVVVGRLGGGYGASAELRDVTGAVEWSRTLDPRPTCAEVLKDVAVVLTLRIEPPQPPPRQGAPEVVGPALGTPMPAPPKEQPPPPAPSTVALLFGARAWADLASAPRPAFGVTADLGFRVAWFSLRAELRWDPPAGATVRDGVDVSTTRLLGALVPCGHTRGDVSFVGCVVGEVGQIQGTLTTSAGAKPTQSGLYSAIGPRLGVDFRISTHLFVQASADLLGVVTRPGFRERDTNLHTGVTTTTVLWETAAFAGGLGGGAGGVFLIMAAPGFVNSSPATLSPGMGSRDLFESLVRTHAELVRRTARRVGVPFADLPDVAQRVFSKLHQALPGLDTSASLAGWVRTTTFRIARDHLGLAYHGREVSSLDEIEAASANPTPEEHMETIDVHAQVDEVLATLRPDLRMVLAMHDMEELPMREIAEVLEIPMTTGYSRLEAARRSFRKSWDRRREEAAAAVAPFALWSAGDLLAAERASVPRSPGGFEDEVWRRVAETLGLGAAGAAGAGAAGAAAAGAAGAAAAAKAGVVLTAAQLAIGVVASALAGAGLYAALHGSPTTGSDARGMATAEIARSEPGGAGSGAPAVSASVVSTPPLVPTSAEASSATAGTRKRDGGAPAPPGEDEGLLLENASRALDRGDARAALGLLARIRSRRFAAERDALRGRALAYQDGGR
jgi:RNA polymerase sigma factor (sigma-70 family)